MKADVVSIVIQTVRTNLGRRSELEAKKKKRTDPDPVVFDEAFLDRANEIVVRCDLQPAEKVGGRPTSRLRIFDRHIGRSKRPDHVLIERIIGDGHTDGDLRGMLNEVAATIRQLVHTRSKRPERRVVRA